MKALKEPSSGELEFSVDGSLGKSGEIGGFGGGTAEEKAQAEEFDLDGVEQFEFVEGAVEVEDLFAGGIYPEELRVESDTGQITAALQSIVLAVMVDQGSTHNFGCQNVEVLAVLQLWGAAGQELEEKFVDNGGGLECSVAMIAVVKLRAGQSAKVWIDERNQALDGGVVAVGPVVEDKSDVDAVWRECHGMKYIDCVDYSNYSSAVSVSPCIYDQRWRFYEVKYPRLIYNLIDSRYIVLGFQSVDSNCRAFWFWGKPESIV